MFEKVRTRFAPSPTGFLHVGGLRTALYAYLLAKKEGGDYILRIEDTDRNRLVEGAVQNLIDSLKWAGVEHNEGPDIGGDYGPYIQSERFDIYKKYAQKLLDSGRAYRCFCTPERLEKMREEQRARKFAPRYDRKCLDLTEEEIQEKLDANIPYVIRFKVSYESDITYEDGLRGKLKFNPREVEDFVILKSDGFPTYHLANVVDDHLMKISHVIRGEEWLPSLPKHLQLYEAFGWEKPEFIHLPLLLSASKKKLSKRDGDVAVGDYKKKGVLPEALLNFVLLLGWNPGDDKEIFSHEEMIEAFSLERLNKSGAVFDLEKLDWMSAQYLKNLSLETLTELCIDEFLAHNLIKKEGDQIIAASGRVLNQKYLEKVVEVERERIKKIADISEEGKVEFFFEKNLNYDKNLLPFKKMEDEAVVQSLEFTKKTLEETPAEDFTKEKLREIFMTAIQKEGFKVGEILHPFRVAVTGQKSSPDPFEVSSVIDKPLALERLHHAIEKTRG